MEKIIILSVFFLILVLLFAFGGLRETIGDAMVKLFPKNHSQKGDIVDIFLNGKYNRTATITKISADKIYIYNNALSLVLDYRGRFYGIGVDPNDGSRLIYVGNRKHYRFIRLAEMIRKAFAVMDDVDNLEATDNPIGEADESQESEVSNDQCLTVFRNIFFMRIMLSAIPGCFGQSILNICRSLFTIITSMIHLPCIRLPKSVARTGWKLPG